MRGAADQAHQRVRAHGREPGELCTGFGAGAGHRGACGRVGAGLRRGGRRGDHHHQVGGAGISRRVAAEGRACQRRRRQCRGPARGRRRDRPARRGPGDRPDRAGQGGSGRAPRSGRGGQAAMVRHLRARRPRHRQGQGPHLTFGCDRVQVARHRARGHGIRRAGVSARARGRRGSADAHLIVLRQGESNRFVRGQRDADTRARRPARNAVLTGQAQQHAS